MVLKRTCVKCGKESVIANAGITKCVWCGGDFKKNLTDPEPTTTIRHKRK